MTHGIKTYVGPQRKANLTPDGVGGVYLERILFGTSYVRRTFTNLGGLDVFYVHIMGGYHTVVKGIDGSGYPYIEAAGFTKPAEWYGDPSQFTTEIAVFAK